MRTDMWQKLVHAFTREIDSTFRCLRTILSPTLNSARYNKHGYIARERTMIPLKKINKRDYAGVHVDGIFQILTI